MDGPASLGDRIRSWFGLEELTPGRFPFLTKLERAEEDVAVMRLAVVVLNGLAYLGLGMRGAPMPEAATAILALAFVYAVSIVLLQVRPAFGEVPWSMVTVGLDAVAIAAWLAATGGWVSPYFPVMYASIAAVGYRYNLPITTAVGVAYVGAYAAVCVVSGGVGSWVVFWLRALYVPLTGTIVGFASEGYADARREHHDTTRRLVDAIETMDRRFAAVLDEAPDLLVLTDADGHVEYANGAVSKLGVAHPVDGRAQGPHAAAIAEAMDDRDTVEYFASPRGEATPSSLWCRAAPIVDEGRSVGAVVTARRAPGWIASGDHHPTVDRRDPSPG